MQNASAHTGKATFASLLVTSELVLPDASWVAQLLFVLCHRLLFTNTVQEFREFLRVCDFAREMVLFCSGF